MKNEAANAAHDPATRAALGQQIVMRQAERVGMAKAAGLREPTGPLDPLDAKPADVASTFMWSEAGGVIPRAEIAHDGGRAFRESVRDAVTLRIAGFDAMLDLVDDARLHPGVVDEHLVPGRMHLPHDGGTAV